MYMVSPDWQQASTDIAETTARIEDIARDLPAIHALSRCDTVAATYSIGELTAIKAVKRGKSLSLMGNVTAHLCPLTLHCKQQNSSQHIMVNMLRGALHLQNEGRKSRPTKLVEEQLQPPNFVHPTNISYVSWKCKTLPLSGVQMIIGIAPRPPISESSWTGLGSRHREQNFVGTKLSRCNCIGTRLHPDLMLLPFRCPVQTGNCSCLRNQLICTVLSSVLVKVIGFVATLTQKIQMVVMMICTCLIMLMLISLVIDRCGEPRPWNHIISSLTILWRVQR